jgi:hypothetical protein
MKRTILLLSVFGSVSCLNAQVKSEYNKTEKAATSTEISFEQFCLKNAVQIIPASTKKVSITSSVPAVDSPNPTYQDFGVQLKENEAQYFTIEGTSNLLKVESLFRLRLMYNSLNK